MGRVAIFLTKMLFGLFFFFYYYYYGGFVLLTDGSSFCITHTLEVYCQETRVFISKSGVNIKCEIKSCHNFHSRANCFAFSIL